MFDPPSFGKIFIPLESREDFLAVMDGIQDIRTNSTFGISWGEHPAWWNPKRVISEKVFITDGNMLVRLILYNQTKTNCTVYLYCAHAY